MALVVVVVLIVSSTVLSKDVEDMEDVVDSLPPFIGEQKNAKTECQYDISRWDVNSIVKSYTSTLRELRTINQPLPQHQKLTIMIPTIPSHTDDFRIQITNHYSKCSNINKILWLWDSSKPISSFLSQTSSSSNNTNRINSTCIRTPAPHGDLTARFLLYPEVDSDIIMSLDDDLLVSCTALSAALTVIIRNPNQYVSFYPRLILCRNNRLQYSWNGAYTTGLYSFGITGAAITTRSVLERFWQKKEKYRELFDKVREKKNCEDILFAFIHWEMEKAPGVMMHWAGHSKTLNREGLSQRGNHGEGRDKCVRRFVKAFGFVPGLTKGMISLA
eukprot:TRINITY_DN25821_c0_g1_i1.p1 TRINITY_DN25821_c0_g1~~TRINITY_DN25821_c0_g1_i1.p1  ORF type:complete len:338 (-),score=56.08 TRINITY_DN25821_c0_g1_i1:80-1072(-)